jgi:hypothetical protein
VCSLFCLTISGTPTHIGAMAHKTPSGKTSGAWRDLERRVEALFRAAGFTSAKRITRANDFGEERPDVDIPEIKGLAVDTKYRNGGFSHHSLFLSEVDKYVGVKRLGEEQPYSWSIMPTRAGGSKDILVTLRLERFLEVLAQAFLRKGHQSNGGWSCPRCPNNLTKTSEMLGLHQYTCQACGLVLLSQEEAIEVVNPEPVRRKRTKDEIIKDQSQDSFHPLPGQLKLRDLIAQKQQTATPKKTRSRKSKGT